VLDDVEDETKGAESWVEAEGTAVEEVASILGALGTISDADAL
jgi:hypothetical protein